MAVAITCCFDGHVLSILYLLSSPFWLVFAVAFFLGSSGAALHPRAVLSHPPRLWALASETGVRPARSHLLPVFERRGRGGRNCVPAPQQFESHPQEGKSAAVAVGAKRRRHGPGRPHLPRSAARGKRAENGGQCVGAPLQFPCPEPLGLHWRLRLRKEEGNGRAMIAMEADQVQGAVASRSSLFQMRFLVHYFCDPPLLMTFEYRARDCRLCLT